MTDASKDITSISEEGTTNNTCHSLACEDRPTLGSSFGGVVFKQSTSPRSRKRCEHSENIFIHDEINEASQQHRENAKCPECFRDVVCSAHCDEAYNSNVNTADVDRLYSCTVSDYIHTEQGIHMSCSHEGNYTEVTNAVCYHKNPPNSCFSGPQVERSASFSCDERPNGELEVRDCDHSTQEGIFKLGNETKHAASNKGEEHCLKGCAMCDQEQMMESHAGRGSYGSRVTSGRTSLNSSPSCVSDNVFYNRSAYQNSASLTDIASASSVSSCQSGSRDTKTSRMRFELRHGRHHHGSDMIEYITPLQRREKQIKDLLHEVSSFGNFLPCKYWNSPSCGKIFVLALDHRNWVGRLGDGRGGGHFFHSRCILYIRVCICVCACVYLLYIHRNLEYLCQINAIFLVYLLFRYFSLP